MKKKRLQVYYVLSFLVFMLGIVCFACTASNTANTSPSKIPDKKRDVFFSAATEKHLETYRITPKQVLKAAESYLGTPHCMGGHSKQCTDCSGLVMAAFAEYGITLPHNSEEQARFGKLIYDKEKLQKGDLIFFIDSYKTDKYITHSGIYMGNDMFIHTSTKKGVTITSLHATWWSDKFVFGTRVF